MNPLVEARRSTRGPQVFRRSTAGITTREVVILVALVLVALVMLIPFFKKGSQQNLAASSAANLMQWGIALNLYLLENENALPLVGPTVADADLAEAWYQALPEYLSLPPRLGNPTDLPGPIWRNPAIPENELAPFGTWFNYGMNRWLQPLPDAASYTIYDLQNPSMTLFLTEISGTDPGALPGKVSYRFVDPNKAPAAHALFCDGHVELIPEEKMSKSPSSDSASGLLWAPFDGAEEPKP